MIFVTMVLKPWDCPLGYPKEGTNCAGCDEFMGLYFMKGDDGLVPTANCAMESPNRPSLATRTYRLMEAEPEGGNDESQHHA